VLVLMPGSGDSIQALKAGPMAKVRLCSEALSTDPVGASRDARCPSKLHSV